MINKKIDLLQVLDIKIEYCSFDKKKIDNYIHKILNGETKIYCERKIFRRDSSH